MSERRRHREHVLALPASPGSVAQAREFVIRCCVGRSFDEAAVALVTSELVTNAVRHGRDDIEVTVTCDHSCVRIEVRDDSRDAPTRREASEADHGGRGLALVEKLATTWWVDWHDDGTKTVGAELPAHAVESSHG